MARRPEEPEQPVAHGHASLGTAAPLVFVLLWSTGYIGAKFGVPYADPLTFLLLRFGLAAVLVTLLAAIARSEWPASRPAWAHAAVTGLLLHAGLQGGVFTAIDLGVPAGITAVIVSLQPVVTSALVAPLLGDRVGRRQWMGLALGLIGVWLVISPGTLGGGLSEGLPAAGLFACLLALIGTTGGTIYQKRYGDEIPLLSGMAIQYGACTAAMLMLAPAAGSLEVRWAVPFIVDLAWLVIALSVGAVLLLLTLLRRGSATRVSSLFYLVPPATATEAYLLFGESLGPVELVGMLIAIVGVALVMTAPTRPTVIAEP
jgi:drug/metabolite transporter (DMT)-like permease